MAPKRGRPKKNKASPIKAVEPTQDTSTPDETTSEALGDKTSINPKQQLNIESICEEVDSKAPIMEIDDLALQSSEHTSQPTDADSHLLYEGDDINQEVSYAPEDVDALLGNDENEGLENPEEGFATGEETAYDDGADGDFTETGDLAEEQVSEENDENSDASSDSKAKAKLVKTTYHYINDKSEEKSGNLFIQTERKNYVNQNGNIRS